MTDRRYGLLDDPWAWRSNMDAPRNVLAQPELTQGPAPTGYDRVQDTIYNWLGGQPDNRRSAEKLATAFDLATMGMATGAYDGGRDVVETGRPASLAMAMLPGARIPAAAGRATNVLAMDFASRMARAKEQGYRLSPVYHGTAAEDGAIFSAFDPSRLGGRTSQSRAGQYGVSVSPSTEVANEFADLAAHRSGGNPAVMPLLHRAENPAVLNLDGTERNLEVAGALADAFGSGGRDAVALKNYTTPGGRTGELAVVLKNPNQLRSVNAAFDPARRHEADLMASRLLPFGAGLGGYGLWPGDEQ